MVESCLSSYMLCTLQVDELKVQFLDIERQAKMRVVEEGALERKTFLGHRHCL
jgi:hypothetical protein